MAKSKVRHPEVTVQLVGENGNAFLIASRTRAALRRSGVSQEECTEFFDDALSGDYDHFLAVVQAWVTVE